jgi:hypothetical protein
MAERAPLTTLLSWTWVAFTMEIDNMVESERTERLGRLVRISTPMWANGLRLIDDDGITVGELRSRARAACNIGGLERWGWISVGEPVPRRAGYGSHRGVTGRTVVRPTRAGAIARRLWPRVIADVEQRWRSRFGHRAVEDLVDALHPTAVGLPAGRMPWSPPEVDPSNGFTSQVIDGPDDEGAGLYVRLGQALAAYTLEHEERAAASLPIGANVLRIVDAGDVRIRDLPRLAGVSKEAVAMATNYLDRRGLARIGSDRSIHLTEAGRVALEDYRERAALPGNPTLRGALDAIVSQPSALADGLAPSEGGWRGTRPYLTQTQRLLADPVQALPWHPMVLHRGGWPDGS